MDVNLPSLARGFSLRALILSHSGCSLYFYSAGARQVFLKLGEDRARQPALLRYRMCSNKTQLLQSFRCLPPISLSLWQRLFPTSCSSFSQDPPAPARAKQLLPQTFRLDTDDPPEVISYICTHS